MTPEILHSLVRLIEVKDLSTAAHTWRVVLYTRAMAEEAGVDHDTISRLTTAAALHDIGKLDIPESILQKPGKLDDAEFEIMKGHAPIGHEHLVSMGEDDPILLSLVRHHHERWDGKGYPDRLAGEKISIGARYFSVIDSFDAMTSVRPYRTQVGDAAAQRAIEELQRGKGAQYFPQAVDLFSDIFRSGKIDWILHYYNDEVPTERFDASAVMKRLRNS